MSEETGRAEFALGPLNHVGVAVPSIEAAIAQYRALYGLVPHGEPFNMAEQGVRVCFLDLPNSQIELIEPYGDASPIRAFLERNPKGGQHHVCFEVADIHEAVAVMKARGATVLNEPRIGAHGTPIVFIHPKDSTGVLVELMESPKPASGEG